LPIKLGVGDGTGVPLAVDVALGDGLALAEAVADGVPLGVAVADGVPLAVAVADGLDDAVELALAEGLGDGHTPSATLSVSILQPGADTASSVPIRKRSLIVCPLTFGPRFTTVSI